MFQGGLLPESSNCWEYEVVRVKKKIIRRGLLGFPLGIAIGYVITIVISVIWANGYYTSVTPALIEAMGNEINAVIFQAVLCGAVGSGYAMASIIWEMDSWSLVKQTGIYFAIASAIMFPAACFGNWMEHSIGGILAYAGIFAAIFILMWLFQYFIWKCRVKKMNECVKSDNDAKRRNP